MKVVTGDGREIECEGIEEGEHGVHLYGRGEQLGFVPYGSLRYAARTRTPVASDSIRSVGYDGEDGELEIGFHHGGVYRYFDVPRGVYEGLLSASSHGGYFHDEIRGEYAYQRLL